MNNIDMKIYILFSSLLARYSIVSYLKKQRENTVHTYGDDTV